ncbi:MAG TPA: ABC transporter ATP-binding protein [Microbacterium sp.]|uniref:ABC transporter ATP-binding protein n=1 Tax=Microbacterium sp. TaxID=51671 RepID=UPI002CC22EA3|nr:ABC transporter ATP-binding protein [Microbacterium sp.]HWI30297.1 ABC transporter ATP-binding protein [Microbacterium sp.]
MTTPEPAAPPAAAAPPAHVDAPLLRLDGVSVRHEGASQPTPAHATFEVRMGEVALVLGPSGSGKSTLALTLNGLIPHALPADVGGTVTVDGLVASETPVAELSTRVAMVFQDPDAQLFTGSVLDEVAFGLENLRMPVADVLERTEAALRRVGLWDRRSWNPDRLSGGGRQRLAIACALAMGSPLLVLDEPTANLDPVGIEDVYAALAEVVAGGDRAIVLIEHNLDAAIPFVDRAVVLDQSGRVVFDGPVGPVLRENADELVRMGVWLPTATLAALRLRDAGFAMEPLPLTPAALRAALAAPEAEAPAPSLAPALTPTPAVTPASAVSTTPRSMPPAGSTSMAVSMPAPPASTALISVRNLTVTRHRRPVLHEIDLDIAEGSFVAVVGANGAGKTTLVQAIAGVLPPPRGRVRVGEIDPGRASPRELAARIGFVFQNPEHQFIANTVFDELAHGLRLRHAPDAEVTARVDELLERFGLADKAGTHPFLLSGGQKRRLSVGTALIAGAPILALDEPTFGQDRARADELLRLLRTLNAEGTTVIVVTHDMQLVAEYASHTVLMADGRIRAAGRTADVFADVALVEGAGLRLPPLTVALQGIPRLGGAIRLADLTPGVTA